ncbi:MAG: hypothetical protein Q8Q86_01750 [Candidatus Daviesbacteria bacterium]|nr:hypothetical protein [Candidatus Daviesbacteria bacterium]
MDLEEVMADDGLGIWLRGNDEFRIRPNFWINSISGPDSFRYLALEANK